MILAALAVAVVAAFAIATARLFVWPTRDRPEPVDAIVMLAGDESGRRLDHALSLAREGYAPVLVVSNPRRHSPCAPTVPGVRLICFDPSPRTTRGEARATTRLAAQYGWRSILVVSGRAQDTRARIRIRRCYSGRVLVSPANPTRSSWPYLIAYEWGALVKAMVWQRGC